VRSCPLTGGKCGCVEGSLRNVNCVNESQAIYDRIGYFPRPLAKTPQEPRQVRKQA
jgi:hypothetical protein